MKYVLIVVLYLFLSVSSLNAQTCPNGTEAQAQAVIVNMNLQHVETKHGEEASLRLFELLKVARNPERLEVWHDTSDDTYLIIGFSGTCIQGYQWVTPNIVRKDKGA